MKKPLKYSLKNIFIFTMLSFAAATALAGILGTVESEAKQRENNFATSLPYDSLEVFSFSSPDVESDVFAEFQEPITGRISSPYGYRTDPFSGEIAFHRGIDIAVTAGTEIEAAATGTVKASAYDSVGGHYIILSHENGTESYYGHLRTRLVSRGDIVRQGDIIGISGASGRVTGAHLHFQLSYNGRTVDPQRYLNLAA